ncbi:helix-turn-helix transcriptional regulator [Streptomyces sp. NPDC048404]|uniref:helix-turn-helix domain-containing protein n=1 Tax=unclassified Streptomyces TaxID=2593676 RepID=UPI003442ADE9
MERNDRSDARAREGFALWLRQQLETRGFDLGIRGGGQSRFAEESGIGRATISRILSGQGATDTAVLARLAEALHTPLGEVLVHAGILNPQELTAINDPAAGPRRITPDQAADELGIQDAHNRRLFIAMAQTLQRTPPPDDAERAAEH